MRAVARIMISAPQGLECTAYFALNLRTAYLQRGLYVAVREEGASQELHPGLSWEHFPAVELVQEGWRRRHRDRLGRLIDRGLG